LRVSVIVPVYNKIEHFLPCLLTNLHHAHEPLEWIIIDNNSDQATKDGLVGFKLDAEKLGHSVKIVNEDHNTGVACAWNKGMGLANSEYVCVLNNDCILMPHWPETLIESERNTQYKIYTPFIVETHMLGDHFTEAFFLSEGWEKLVKVNKNRKRNGIFGGVVFFGKKIYFEQVGAFDEKFWLSLEDMDYLVRCQRGGIQIGTVGCVVGFHHASTTRKGFNLDEEPNQTYFQQKYGWNFELNEHRFVNRMVKSWNKFLLRKFLILGNSNLSLPK